MGTEQKINFPTPLNKYYVINKYNKQPSRSYQKIATASISRVMYYTTLYMWCIVLVL